MAKKNKKIKIWIAASAAALVIFSVLSVAWIFEASHEGRIYPGVMVGSFSVGGLGEQEAQDLMQSQIKSLRKNGLVFKFKDRKVNLPMAMVSTSDPDLSRELISYNVTETLSPALEYGRRGSFVKQWRERLYGVFFQKRITPVFEWDRKNIMDILKENFSSFEHPAGDAKLVVENWRAKITKEQSGFVFDYQSALKKARGQLGDLMFSPIKVELKKDEPALSRQEALPLLEKARESVYKNGVRITYEDFSWYLPSITINSALEIRKNKTGKAEIGFSKKAFGDFFKRVSSGINVEPQEPRFALEEGKVEAFQTGAQGRRLNEDQTRGKLEKELLGPNAPVSEFGIVVDIIQPNQKISDLNDLGVKELLGVGKTNFAGSPYNRRHNISTGADKLKGMLVEPDEEFSLVKAIGEVNRRTGYLPELVIKGNETIPEYGGGLCQIGTTVFRTVLNSGLPITERRPHSYTVSYYFDEKGRPGKDATIYIPHPDLRFINDTKAHILIFTKIDGSDLIFEFWGTRDGREVEQTDVAVWGRVPPPETKYVETLDIPVGETKCTEYPHAGMKASFDYIVTYPDATVKEETFFSHYKPWQEVCLVGVEELSEKEASGEENKESEQGDVSQEDGQAG